MGTWLGHATTGSFFFAVGLWLFIRALGLSYLRGLRERGFWLILPAWLQLFGGYALRFELSLSSARELHVALPPAHPP